MINIQIEDLILKGLSSSSARELYNEIHSISKKTKKPEEIWDFLIPHLTKYHDFSIQYFIFTRIFPKWHEEPESAPAYLAKDISNTNLYKIMQSFGFNDVNTFHHFSYTEYETFLKKMIETLKIKFQSPYSKIVDLSNGVESPEWFKDAKMNIAESCFKANPNNIAIIIHTEKGIKKMSYQKLYELASQIANGLCELGFKTGDAIAITMPMNEYAVAIYLGILMMGGIVVSIADSFSSDEIALRLNITNAKGIFTQDFMRWSQKILSLYPKIKEAKNKYDAHLKIMLIKNEFDQHQIHDKEDISFEFFSKQKNQFNIIPLSPMSPCNILFSSGTTGTPKAIIWNHTTPIKAASDAYLHQNIKEKDVLCWPTNLGWMMGPWLIFAALINQGTIALYTEAPKDSAFGKFIEEAKVTMLGVVPTLVASWRESRCMEKCDWSSIKLFSSTGECSNPDDMLYLMSLAHYKPIIEYCGGTEIGGAYISSTVLQNNYPSLFTTPTMGLQFTILNEEGHVSDIGEVAILPPSIGLSTTLLNKNHHEIYYKNMPTLKNKILRRHGDFIKKIASHLYLLLGRTDDTMNLGGIKTSAAEIERAIAGIENIQETAAIAIAKNKGPSQLIIFAVTTDELNKEEIKQKMQKKINTYLNPLFKISDIVFVKQLPKTASNKIIRRALREMYS